MDTRGFAAIGLDNPKFGVNVGGTLRAAQCYSAALVVVGGPRPKKMMRHPADTTLAYRHIPTVFAEDVFDAIPYRAVPIAIDLLPDAEPLDTFEHPERAFYIFGAEDATLGKRITSRCAVSVYVPTAYCMNLAATVNVVLYDRLTKQRRTALEGPQNGANGVSSVLTG